jgi:hypothetical protein
VDVPVRRLTNERIADDTHVVRQLFGEGLAPAVLFSNSMVITGTEPILVDDEHLERVRTLGASVIASAHGPATRGVQIDRSLELLKELPNLPPAPLPGQPELELVLEVMASAMAVPAPN